MTPHFPNSSHDPVGLIRNLSRRGKIESLVVQSGCGMAGEFVGRPKAAVKAPHAKRWRAGQIARDDATRLECGDFSTARGTWWSHRLHAFSLIEIMVVVALLSVIILGLLLMFNQTQRAFRTGMTQVDVLEGGRAATAMLARELSQIAPAYRGSNVANFLTFIPNVPPLYQSLPGAPGRQRTNLLQDLYFLTRENQTWRGIGYRVSDLNSGVGSLFRFEATNHVVFNDPGFLQARYTNTPLNNMSRVVDGVVHFRIRAFDTNGVWIVENLQPTASANTDIRWSTRDTADVPGEIGWNNFFSNAVPAFVEFELGILEERTLARARALPIAGDVRRNFLADQAARTHIFRLRVPVRNVDVTAYQ